MRLLSSETASIPSFSAKHAAAMRVGLGVRFQLETVDCYNGQVSSERVLRPHIDMAQFNKATGPVEIDGVQAGDAISIEIESIELGSVGVMAVSPGLGLLGEQVSEAETRLVPIRDGRAWITDGVGVPISPMIGVLGVAPAEGEILNAWPGDHGGNLDTRLLRAGSALLVRAQHVGALVAGGDLHAAQGDGELGGTGIEISGRVTLRVERSGYGGLLPAVRHSAGLSILGSAETLEKALERAFNEAVTLMQGWHSLTWNDAYRLTSVVGQAETSQIVNPLVTARVTIPAEWCPDSLVQSNND